MDSSPSMKIKTIQAAEVPITEKKGKKIRICSFPIRIIWEVLLVFLLFIPLLLFTSKWPAAKDFIHGKVLAKTRLAPGSPGLESWLNSPVKTIRAYRLFNITNYMDIMTDRTGPLMEIQETKPMMYRLVTKKNNVEWLDDNKKIHYSVERIFTREGKFSDELLNQQGAFVDILRVMFRTKFGRVANTVFYMLGGNIAFNYSKVVDKLEGYVSPIFSAIAAKMQGPNKEKYGFIYRYNGSNGYNFTIHSGIDNSTMKGQVVNFATEYSSFMTDANQWKTDFFDALTFPSLGNPPSRKVINVFQADFCRPVQLRYNRTVSMFGFHQLHEYVLKLVDFEKCPEMDENCTESDKLDITKCLSAELPEETVLLTKPHMYGHNSSSTNVAFTPDFDKHESTIYFEPISGTPVRAQLRIQLNTNAWIDRVTIDGDGEIKTTKSRAVPRFTPMLWIDQTITVDDAPLNRLKRVTKLIHVLDNMHQSIKLVFIILALLSVIAIIVVIELFFWNRRRQMNQKSLYRHNEQEKALLNHTLTTTPTTA